MGLKIANSVVIAAGDKFIKFIKNVQKNATGQWMHPKLFAATTCNHMHVLMATQTHF
jgi:hypothetical protein